MVPLEAEFGWSRAAISGGGRHQHRAVRPDRAVRGVGDEPLGPAPPGPGGARAAGGVGGADAPGCSNQWQMTLLWGVCVGTGTGVTSMVLAAVVATRWFDGAARRRARRALGGERHRAAGLPAAAGARGRAPGMARGDADRRRRGGGRLRRRADLHARPAAGPRAAAVRRAGRDRAPAAGRAVAVRRAAPGGQVAGILGPGRHVLRLRRQHERPDRHTPDRRLPRSTASPKSARRSCSR